MSQTSFQSPAASARREATATTLAEKPSENLHTLRRLKDSDIGQAVSLISRAMNPAEGGFAAQTLHFHFSCRQRGIDDGRTCYALTEEGRIIGLAGLHHYCWGPPENVWLSWFAVEPESHGRGLGASLLSAMIEEARKRGFRRLFIETYSTPEFARARAFYAAQGFQQVAAIPAWLSDGGDMVIFLKNLF